MYRLLKSSFHEIYLKFFTNENSAIQRWDHLDGYRGFLAILVVLQHCEGIYHLEGDYQIFQHVGNFVGVSGFFALSSFLLTYRLLKDFDKATCFTDVFSAIAKYTTKRFLRIYMTFFVFASLINIFDLDKQFGGFTFSSWYSLVTLNR